MPIDVADIPMSGTPEQAFKRLAWLRETQDDDGWATPSAYALCRRLFECWPRCRSVPFFYPTSGAIEISDDEVCAAIRVGPAGVALVTWDWESNAHCEQYTSLDRATLRRVLPHWLDIIDQSERYEDWCTDQAAPITERDALASSSDGTHRDRQRLPDDLLPSSRGPSRIFLYGVPILFAVVIIIAWLLLLEVARAVLDPGPAGTDSLPAAVSYLTAQA